MSLGNHPREGGRHHRWGGRWDPCLNEGVAWCQKYDNCQDGGTGDASGGVIQIDCNGHERARAAGNDGDDDQHAKSRFSFNLEVEFHRQGEANVTANRRRDVEGGQSSRSSVGGRECRNNWPLW